MAKQIPPQFAKHEKSEKKTGKPAKVAPAMKKAMGKRGARGC